MIKVKHLVFVSIAALLTIITLREVGGHIKLAVVTAVTYIAHISGNDIATWLAVGFNAMQIGFYVYDRRKNKGQK